MKKLICLELAAILGVLSLLMVYVVRSEKNVGNYDETRIAVNEIPTIYQKHEAVDMQITRKAELTEREAEQENAKMPVEDAIEKQTDIADAGLETELPGNPEEIILVNKDNCLPEDYEVTLKTMPDRVNKAAEEAYGPLCDMLAAGRKEGLAFEICSSYRSVERQQELFDEDLRALIRKGYSYQEAYEEVASETMPPGHSEHSTGLAFDIVSLGYQILDARQENTAENKWLQEHCAEYGFILRYPKGKEDITHINYESWHFRYVGVEVAEYIMEQGITLEEYLEAV